LLAHIAYAKTLSAIHPTLDDPKFIRATIFPDSRQITGTSRSQTHWDGATLSSVLAKPNAWLSGLEFHNWLHDTWNKFFYQYGLKFGRPEDESSWLALKLIMEKMSFKRLSNEIEHIKSYIQDMDPEALMSIPDNSKIELWYTAAAQYMRKPTRTMWLQWAKDTAAPPEIFNNALGHLNEFGSDHTWTSRIAACDSYLLKEIASSS
jgi:hypothetical protein